jgi:hypothetical protein
VRGLADRGRHDVDLDDEEPAIVDRRDDRADQCLTVAIGD